MIAIGLIFSLAAACLAVYIIWPKFQKSETTLSPSPLLSTQPTDSELKNEIFIATNKDGVLSILIFDPNKNMAVTSKEIPLEDSLSTYSSNGAWGANNAVQYNPKTQEIFFSTGGQAAYDGSCINKDGTCVSRLYKIGLEQTKPIIIFESNSMPVNWVVNSFDNSLLLSFLDGKTQTIKKINTQDGKVVFSKEYLTKPQMGLTDFVLSIDGKFTYQASKESVDGKWFYEILRLRKINNANGDISEQEIFGGEAVEYETNLSPDNNYFAFYSGARNLSKLYIYEISTQKLTNVPYQGSIGNNNLLWSGDSKKLLYLLKNSLTYYDIPTSKSTLVIGDTQQTTYVYAWAASTNYFAYQSQNGGVKIFDVKNSRVIDTQIKTSVSEVNGVSWY